MKTAGSINNQCIGAIRAFFCGRTPCADSMGHSGFVRRQFRLMRQSFADSGNVGEIARMKNGRSGGNTLGQQARKRLPRGRMTIAQSAIAEMGSQSVFTGKGLTGLNRKQFRSVCCAGFYALVLNHCRGHVRGFRGMAEKDLAERPLYRNELHVPAFDIACVKSTLRNAN